MFFWQSNWQFTNNCSRYLSSEFIYSSNKSKNQIALSWNETQQGLSFWPFISWKKKTSWRWFIHDWKRSFFQIKKNVIAEIRQGRILTWEVKNLETCFTLRSNVINWSRNINKLHLNTWCRYQNIRSRDHSKKFFQLSLRAGSQESYKPNDNFALMFGLLHCK